MDEWHSFIPHLLHIKGNTVRMLFLHPSLLTFAFHGAEVSTV